MNKKELVLNALKPKIKAYGFSKDEVEGIAAAIADNLEIEDSASDEEASESVNKAVDAVLPYLQFSQKASNRVIEEFKRSQRRQEPPRHDGKDDGDDDVPQWAKQLMESNKSLTEELKALKAEKQTKSRRGRLEGIVKDSGKYGERILKSFDRMSFETDEEFDEFLSETEEDIKAYVQELADKGLSSLVSPPTTHARKNDNPEVITDSEIEALADQF